MLEDPQLALQVRALPAPVLRQVVLGVGLEDAAELIELSTVEQLREVFDEDLWQSPKPGQDETFDVARFVVWLEVMLEVGGTFVADRLAELSEDFLVFVISHLVRVLDSTVIAASISDPSEADLLDKALDAQLCQELDDYLLVSRIENGWDAVLATLVALDERHSPLLRAVLRRCSIIAQEEVEDAGELYEALSEEEQLLERTLQELLDQDPNAYRHIVEELAYLANVLVAGDTSVARSSRPVEAAEPVLDLCDEGLRLIADRSARPDPASAREELLRWGAVATFRVAWASRGEPG
jgi:hypothetical protein